MTTASSTAAPEATPSAMPTTTPTVPLGDTGTALRAGLTGALAAGAWPADLTPTLDQWATTQDKSPGMAACVATVP